MVELSGNGHSPRRQPRRTDERLEKARQYRGDLF